MEYLPHAISNLYAAADAIVAVTIAIIGIVVFVGRRAPSALGFSILTFSIFVWSFSVSQIYSVDTPGALLTWVRLSYASGSCTTPAFYLYALLVSSSHPSLRSRIGFTLLTQIIFGTILLATPLVVNDASILSFSSPLDRMWTFGDFSWISPFNFAAFLILGLREISAIFRDSPLPSAKHHNERNTILKMAVWGIVPSISLTIFLPRIGFFAAYWIGPIILLAWAIFIMFALLKYKFLSVKFYTIEIIILGFIGVLFLSILAPLFVENLKLIPTSHTFSLFNVFTIILSVIIAILIVAGTLLYRGSTTRASRLIFTIIPLFASALLGGIFYYDVSSAYPTIIVIGSRAAFYFGFTVSLAFLFLAASFGIEGELPAHLRSLRKFLVTFGVVMFPIFMFSPLVIDHTIIPANPNDVANRNPYFSPFALIFFTLPYAISALVGGATIIYRAIKETDERLRRHLRSIAILSWIFLVPTGLIHAFEVLYPEILETTFMPFTIAAWILGVLYLTLRHEIKMVRAFVPITVVFVLLGGLFFGVFVDVSPDLFTLELRQMSESSPYVIINWVVALVFAVFGLYAYISRTSIISKPYALMMFAAMEWSIGIGFFYLTTDPFLISLLARHNVIVAIGIGLVFCFYMLRATGMFASRAIRWIFALSQIGVASITLFTPWVISSVIVVTPLDRAFVWGPLGFLPFLNEGLCLIAANWVMFRHVPTLYPDIYPRIKKVIRFLFFALLPIVIIITAAVVELKFNYWFFTSVTLGIFVVASYPFIKFNVLSLPAYYALIGSFVVVSLIFGAIIVPQEIVANFLSRISIFLAFAIIGRLFVGNVVRTEEQREELERVTKELNTLSATLSTRVAEKTRDIENATTHTETIIETFTHGLLEFDDSFTLVRINKTAEEMLGISRFAFLGKQILPELQRTPEYASLAAVSYPALAEHAERVEPKTVGIEPPAAVHIVQTSHPHTAELQVITAPIVTSQGTTTGFIKVLRDITHERMIAKSKSEFISIAAHQLRTPLSIIRWSISLLLSGDQGKLTPPQTETLEKAEETNNRMIELVNDLLDVARIEERKLQYVFDESDIIATIHNALALLAQFSKRQGVVVQFEQPASPFPRFTFDAQRIGHALSVVIDNAIRYSPRGSTVSIRLSERANHVEIVVRDTGIGISREQISRLFTKFFRAENAIRTAPDGFGLGLYIAKNIIVRHGGTIDVSSDVSVGTVTTIRLPLDAQKIPREAAPIEEAGLELIEGRL